MFFTVFNRSFLHTQPSPTIGLARVPRLLNTCRPRQFHSNLFRISSSRAITPIQTPTWSGTRCLTAQSTSRLESPRFNTRAITVACATVGLTLGLSLQTIQCDSPNARIASDITSESKTPLPPLPSHEPPPESSINALELSFGTICGICTGVFIKKGLRAVAFLLGGLFVLAQYLASKQIIRVNWSQLGSRYEKTFNENGKAPTVTTIWKRFIDFILADFPPRATFLAGLILGLRVG